MVFDKNAHFCLNAMKASVADEADVVTIRHDDVDELESLCRNNPHVAYVADTVYSTGGKAPLKELFALQDKYGLILILDGLTAPRSSVPAGVGPSSTSSARSATARSC